MSQEVSEWLVNGLQPTSKWDIPCGYHPLILTFDPNFQRDIQVLKERYTPKELLQKKKKHVTWKIVVERLLSFWNGPFLGDVR